MVFNRACLQKTFNFILIVIRHSKNKKKYPRHKIEYIYIYIYICIYLYLEIPIFLLIFDFTAFPYFYKGYSALKILLNIFAFDTILNKN